MSTNHEKVAIEVTERVREAARGTPLWVQVRRAYDDPAPEDGMRVLVDRLWPRRLSKEALVLDRWAKEIAPSAGLRRWYGHEPERFEEFGRRYASELEQEPNAGQVRELRRIASDQQITLITNHRREGR